MAIASAMVEESPNQIEVPGGALASARPSPRSARAVSRPPSLRSQAPSAGYAGITRARLVAFTGLAALTAAVAIIFASSGGGAGKPLVSVTSRTAAHPRYWVVAPGQSPSVIAARERVGLAELERLNAGLAPNHLIAGQRVRLPG